MEGRQLFRLTRVDTPDLRRHMARLPDRHACHPLGRLERDKPLWRGGRVVKGSRL